MHVSMMVARQIIIIRRVMIEDHWQSVTNGSISACLGTGPGFTPTSSSTAVSA